MREIRPVRWYYMSFYQDTHHRQSIRLRGFDYASPGAYFVTIVTQSRECLFGDVVAGVMVLNDAGHVADMCWRAIPTHFPHTTLDTYQIMPNHVHGIIWITDRPTNGVGVENFQPLRVNRYQYVIPKSFPSIVRGYKIGVTIGIRQFHSWFAWQRNYWEHIIRNDDELNRIRQYIMDNPRNWEMDPEHRI